MVTQLQVLEAIYGNYNPYRSDEIAAARRVLALFEPEPDKSLRVGDMLSTEQDYENAPVGTKVSRLFDVPGFWVKRGNGNWYVDDDHKGVGYLGLTGTRTVFRVGCGYAEGDTLEGSEAYQNAPAGVTVVDDDFPGVRHNITSNGDGSWTCDQCSGPRLDYLISERTIVAVPNA